MPDRDYLQDARRAADNGSEPNHTCTKHEPGSASCVRRHRCPCTPCRTAYARQKKYSRAGICDLIDAAPVQAHIERLLKAGGTPSGIATAAGLSNSQIVYTMAATTRRIKHTTAARILAVTQPDGTLDPTGTRRRIQALIANGWSCALLSDRLGLTRAAVHHWLSSNRVTRHTADRVQTLYDQLWDQAPPETTPMERMAANRNRSLAQRRGWPVPMAWDDDQIDDPNTQPAVQPATQSGNKTADLIDAIEFGASLANLTDRFHLRPDSIYTALKRAGRTDLWHRISARMDRNQPETRAA